MELKNASPEPNFFSCAEIRRPPLFLLGLNHPPLFFLQAQLGPWVASPTPFPSGSSTTFGPCSSLPPAQLFLATPQAQLVPLLALLAKAAQPASWLASLPPSGLFRRQKNYQNKWWHWRFKPATTWVGGHSFTTQLHLTMFRSIQK